MVCDDCDNFYIGQTCWAFVERFIEHLHKINLNTVKSYYANDIQSLIHRFESNCKPLCVWSKGHYMNATEEIEMYKAFKNNQNNVLNDRLDFKSHGIVGEAKMNRTLCYTVIRRIDNWKIYIIQCVALENTRTLMCMCNTVSMFNEFSLDWFLSFNQFLRCSHRFRNALVNRRVGKQSWGRTN